MILLSGKRYHCNFLEMVDAMRLIELKTKSSVSSKDMNTIRKAIVLFEAQYSDIVEKFIEYFQSKIWLGMRHFCDKNDSVAKYNQNFELISCHCTDKQNRVAKMQIEERQILDLTKCVPDKCWCSQDEDEFPFVYVIELILND